MAFQQTMIWEVRTTGSDANGGGFDPTSGTPGTDYSQQDAVQVTYTDLVIDGTTNTKCTSAINPFTSAHVGNVVNITSGTGFTVQRVQVISVTGSTATMDKSLGTLSSTGGHGVLGGALASPGQASALAVTSNTTFVKSGTYTLSNSSNVAGGRMTYAGIVLCGYNTTRSVYNTDATRPVLQPSTNSTTLFTTNSDHILINNIDFEANSKTSCTAVDGSAWNATKIVNCKSASLATGFNLGSECMVAFSEVSGTTTTNAGIKAGGGSLVYACEVHDGTGIAVGSTAGDGAGSHVVDCLVYNITAAGTNTAGIYIASNSSAINCSVYNVAVTGAPGFSLVGGNDPAWCVNCVASTVNPATGSGYGFDAVTSHFANRLINCAGYNNKTADVHTANIAANQQLGFVALSSDPFVATGSNNFALSSAALGGKLLLNTGLPGLFPRGSSTGYPSIGAVQPQSQIPLVTSAWRPRARME